jgi:hypothetical protein
VKRYSVSRRSDAQPPWCVVDGETGEVVGSYDTRAEARFMAAQLNEAQSTREAK